MTRAGAVPSPARMSPGPRPDRLYSRRLGQDHYERVRDQLPGRSSQEETEGSEARLPERSLPRTSKVRPRGRGSHRPAVGTCPDRWSMRTRSAAVLGGGYGAAVPIAPSTQEDAVAEVEAHITGTVWKIECEVGDEVEEGDTVVILESMKMEMPVEAEDAGVVREILCEEGQAVNEGDTLVILE